MNVLIPFKMSAWAGEELRYALRSIEKHVKDLDEVWVIGDKPKWLTGVNHIEMGDHPDNRFKERNIMSKVREYFKHCDGDVLFTNDDIFLLKDILAQGYPYYYNRPLTFTNGNPGPYKASQNNTIGVLKEKGLKTLNYDIHVPIVYRKEWFLSVMDGVDWNIPYGYVIKSLYSNSLDVMGVEHADLKINAQKPYFALRRDLQGVDVFSIGDRTLGVPLKKLLNEFFTEKSRYEQSI
jgi:hypothetical protein